MIFLLRVPSTARTPGSSSSQLGHLPTQPREVSEELGARQGGCRAWVRLVPRPPAASIASLCAPAAALQPSACEPSGDQPRPGWGLGGGCGGLEGQPEVQKSTGQTPGLEKFGRLGEV